MQDRSSIHNVTISLQSVVSTNIIFLTEISMKNYANYANARTDGKLFSLTQSRYLKVCLKNRAKIELYQFFHRSEQKFKIPILVI